MEQDLLDISEITDSKEVMLQKTPTLIIWFISITFSLVIILLTWSFFGKIDTYVTASGEIRPTDNLSTVTVSMGGKIKEVYCSEGDIVSAGDILFSIDSDYYEEQKESLLTQIKEKEAEKKNYKKLIKCIKKDKNSFDLEKDAIFYYQYESYRIEVKDTLQQISTNNKQVNATKKEINSTIKQITSSIASTKALYSEYERLYSAISSDKKYTSKNKVTNSWYQSYVATLNKAQLAYDTARNAYNDLVAQKNENNDAVTDSQIKNAENQMNAAHSELNAVKSNALNDISSIMQDLTSKKNTYQSELESNSLRLNSLMLDNTQTSSKEKIKNNYFISITNTISSIDAELLSLNERLRDVEKSLEMSCIYANISGKVFLTRDFVKGDVIESGATVANIIPDESNYCVILYVPEYNISSISVGQDVEYTFNGISVTDFGKVNGKITEISVDSVADNRTGEKYYKVKGDLDKFFLKDKKGETRQIKVGMITNAHAITGTQSIFSWLLDKLGL